MLPRVTREAANRYGDATGYVAPGGWALSYTDVDRLSDRVAVGMLDRGVRHGDVISLVLPPGVEYLVAYLAAAKLGAITAGVNHRLTTAEREAVLAVADPVLVIDDIERAASPGDVLADFQRDGTAPVLPDDPDRAVAIIFTSGTTGLPKGALYTERQLAFITHTDTGDRWGGGTRTFTGTSFAHLGFMTKLPGALMRGGTTFILERWRAHDCLDLLAREGMTSVAGVPTQLALMLAEPDFDAFDLSSVQAIIVGGGPVSPGLATEARARFGAALSTRYSCTEAGIGLGTAFDDPEEDAIVSVGRPHASVDLAVLDEEDQPVTTGEVGAVCLRSEAVMQGYWHDPEATRSAFTASGHVRTGDIGWVDDTGRLRLVGRTKEMYVRGGYNVYPVEVEGVLSTHPAIRAVAVVPRHDPVMGEIGVVVVVSDGPTPTLTDIRGFAAQQLAHHKLPEAMVALDALPLTAGDKIDRRALAALVADEQMHRSALPRLKPPGTSGARS